MDIEKVIGSAFNDHLDKSGGDIISVLTLSGGAGDDWLGTTDSFNATLNGDAGDDKLEAISAEATLNGGAGDDHLSAGWGGFTLNGGTGKDVIDVGGGQTDATVNGGSGADTLTHVPSGVSNDDTILFDYNVVSESPAGVGRDTITGFQGEGIAVSDQIDLKDIDANSLVSGNQAFTWIGGAAFTAAGQLRYNTTTGLLQGSTDGDAAAEFEIQLVGAPALTVGGAGTDILL